MVVPHSGGYPHAKFEGNLLLFKFGPHTKSGLTIPQCVRGREGRGCELTQLRSAGIENRLTRSDKPLTPISGGESKMGEKYK